MTLKRSARLGTTSRHMCLVCGHPCSNTTSGPLPVRSDAIVEAIPQACRAQVPVWLVGCPENIDPDLSFRAQRGIALRLRPRVLSATRSVPLARPVGPVVVPPRDDRSGFTRPVGTLS